MSSARASSPHDQDRDYVGFLTALLVAIAPILPAAASALHVAPIVLVGIWLLPLGILALWSAIATYKASPAFRNPFYADMIAWIWGALIVALGGAAVIGLMATNRIGSPIFVAHLGELPERLAQPMNAVEDQLYPIKAWLVFAVGYLCFLFVSVICRRGSATRRRARLVLTGWILGFACVSVVALVQYLTRYRLHPFWVEANPNLVRTHATLDDPNALGAFLLLGLGLTLGRWRNVEKRWPYALLVITGVLALCTTVSRASIAAAILIGASFVAFAPAQLASVPKRVRSTSRWFLLVTVLVAAASVGSRLVTEPSVTYAPRSPLHAVVQTLDPRVSLADALEHRTVWWSLALQLGCERPLTGVGLGRYPRLLSRHVGEAQHAENAHNLYMQLFAEAGIIGVGLFVAVIVTTIARLLGGVHSSELVGAGEHWETLGLSLGIAAVAVTLFSAHNLLLVSGQITWASAVAPGLAMVQVPRRMNRSSAGRLGTAIVLLLVAATPFLWIPAGTADTATDQEPWGYFWGLYPAERNATGERFRWSGPEVKLELKLPSNAVGVRLPMAAPTPVRSGRATRVWVFTTVESRVVRFADARLKNVDLRRPEPHSVARAFTVRIDVEPTFVPSALANSDDSRVLGVQLFEPQPIFAETERAEPANDFETDRRR